MKIDAIQSNSGIFSNNFNNTSKKPSFRAVYTQPYILCSVAAPCIHARRKISVHQR